MAKITIEDDCGEEKTFTVSDESAEKIKTCIITKKKSNLGDDESGIVNMLNDEGEVVSFFLERDCDGIIHVKSFIEENEDKDDAEDECYFETDGNNTSYEGHYFS